MLYSCQTFIQFILTFFWIYLHKKLTTNIASRMYNTLLIELYNTLMPSYFWNCYHAFSCFKLSIIFIIVAGTCRNWFQISRLKRWKGFGEHDGLHLQVDTSMFGKFRQLSVSILVVCFLRLCQINYTHSNFTTIWLLLSPFLSIFAVADRQRQS